jgi:transposase
MSLKCQQQTLDADSFRNWLKRRKIKAVIPSTATRRTPYPLDQKTYRRRNVIERMFCKLKTGDASRPDMIATPKTTPQDSYSPPSCVSGFE